MPVDDDATKVFSCLRMCQMKGSIVCLACIGIFLCVLTGCGTSEPPVAALLQADPPPAAPSSNTLPNYDAAVTSLLDQVTESPATNSGGDVVWNTRYYMESLLAAYNATGNQKYINSLLATGSDVLGLVQSLTVLNIPDPSAPGPTKTGPMITVTGWPTSIGTFNGSVSVPTADGHVSFYAQVLRPASGLADLEIAQMSPSGLLLNWQTAGGVTLATNAVNSESDLDSIANAPLDYFKSTYRIANTGLGLPSPGSYSLGTPLSMVWHGEQTGGILLPFVRFLVLAKLRPSIADPATVRDWTSQVVSIADSYENQLVPDGNGGLVITNPYWMPSTEASTPASSDYTNAEITMRMLLYELTGDTQELSLAKGLMTHEMANLQTSAAGWLLLKAWPDIHSWSSKSQAPYGSIYDTLTYDNSAPDPIGEGAFFVEMLQTAVDYNLVSSLGLSTSLYGIQLGTFDQYLRIPYSGSRGLIQDAYPTAGSGPGGPINPSPIPFQASFYVAPITSPASFVCDNWKWMMANGQSLESSYGGGVGYPLLAWARAEAAELADQGECPAQ
jgi:hypothetical protein